jgi:hypothetical protein
MMDLCVLRLKAYLMRSTSLANVRGFIGFFFTEQTPYSPLFVAPTTDAFDCCWIHVNIQFENDAEQKTTKTVTSATATVNIIIIFK